MFFDTNFRGKMAKQSLQKATGLIRKVSVAKVNVKCQKQNCNEIFTLPMF